MGVALTQIREVADHLQTLVAQADVLSLKYESESDRGRELARLLRQVEALKRIGGENLSGICLYVPRSVLNNWTAEEIPIVFRANSESPYINDTSDAATDSKSPFERDMCLEGSQDFEDDRDCNLSPDLLRMVEQEEK
ncbi:trans-resveratrol di-O-methyltransferase-like [Gossypium australe]|uniref:Trans-resveratrol di-O-methyltransferase-like n=1 Tax=Gossypium australe TaxID=47621 RepID=A0A5B6WHX9_9ROSI|nr:trans-resveratrol di-O-methyltransferase-like [Gossypium australe]